jgi:sugar lactone lactonase YvrE
MKIDLAGVKRVGTGLKRPECVLATESGDLFIAHLGHGIMHIDPAGRQRTIGNVTEVDGDPFIPNGVALLPDRSFLIATMSERGGLWKLSPTGAIAPVLREVDGQRLGATNFVLTDEAQRIWVTVTTRHWPISKAMTPPKGPHLADGYIVLIDKKGARIVADGLVFTNEVRLDAEGRHLYVVETFGRRITRFKLGADGSLSGRELFTSFGHGTFPDGMAFDAEGHLWVASIISNRLIRVAPDGSQEIVLEDSDAAHIDQIERTLADGTLRREDMQRTPGRVLKNIASIAFGGRDLRTAYLGSLGGDSLAVFRSPVAGAVPPHWRY